MSINLPGYGTAGWGATLNNYLRSLEKRLNVIEGKVNSNSTVEEQILAVSRYAGSGLTSTSTKIKRNASDITSTTSISDGDVLSFENLSYYIAASLTNSGGSHITFDTAKTWTFKESDLTINQSTLLVIDQNGVISLLPKNVNGSATGTTPTNLNFCRLGYITKLDEDYLFTPAPEIASLNTSSKFEFWSSPKIRTQRQNSNKEYIGSFVFGAEGLGYFANSNTNNINNIYINDFNLYNSYQYDDPSGYYTIADNGTVSYGEYDINSNDTVDSLFTTTNNKKIRFYYVTLTGEAFCYVHEVEKIEEIPTTSQELGAYQLSHDQTMGLHVLFDNYSYVCPVEVCRLTRNKYGTIVSYSNTYNGFPPQLHNTPVFGSNNEVKWNQFHFMQEAATLDPTINLPTNTLRIKPIVNTGTGSNNPVVIIDTTSSTTVENDEILLMNHEYKKRLNIRSSGHISIQSNTFGFSGNSSGYLSAPNELNISTDDFYISDYDDYIKVEVLALNDEIDSSSSLGIAGVLCITDNKDLASTNYAETGQIWYQDGKLKLTGLEGVTVESSFEVSGKTTIDNDLDVKGTVTWTSDRNLKTNITPMVFNSTEFINLIPLYNYALKSTPNNQTIGLMAQDLQQYLPQLVHEAQDGHLTIEETKLVYICMDALKQANQRIELLEGKVNDLCNKISQYHL